MPITAAVDTRSRMAMAGDIPYDTVGLSSSCRKQINGAWYHFRVQFLHADRLAELGRPMVSIWQTAVPSDRMAGHCGRSGIILAQMA